MMNSRLFFFVMTFLFFFMAYFGYKIWTYAPELVEVSGDIYATPNAVYEAITVDKTNWMPHIKEAHIVTNAEEEVIEREIIEVEDRLFQYKVITVSNIPSQLLTIKKSIPKAQEVYKTYLLRENDHDHTHLVIKQSTKYLHPVAKSSAALLDKLTFDSLVEELSALKEYSENLKTGLPPTVSTNPSPEKTNQVLSPRQ